MNLARVLILTSTLSFAIAESAFLQPISVSLPADTTGAVGTSVTIPIRVEDLTDRNIIAYQATITFDESVLDATGASSTNTLSGAFGPPAVNVAMDGEISVGGFGASPLAGSGILVNVTFDIVGQPGDTTDLAFASFAFNSGEPSADTQDGKFIISFPTGVPGAPSIPESFRLRQNYPNPFNPETAISFDVPAAWNTPVILQIFNLRGQLVKTLFNGYLSSGEHVISWDGRDVTDEPVASGFYIYRITSGDFMSVRRMLLVK